MDMGNQWQCRVCSQWSDAMGGHDCQKVVVDKGKLNRLQSAVALLNSMVLSGESHSDMSRAVVRAAMDDA